MNLDVFSHGNKQDFLTILNLFEEAKIFSIFEAKKLIEDDLEQERLSLISKEKSPIKFKKLLKTSCPKCGRGMVFEPKGRKEAVWNCKGKSGCSYSKYIEVI